MALDALAEERIREAQARGEFDGLPGSGRPLELDDDAMVPEELRAAYRVLKNSGFVPPEIEAHRELRDVECLLRAAATEVELTGLLARIDFLLTRTSAGRRHGSLRVQEEAYLERVAERLEARRRPGRAAAPPITSRLRPGAPPAPGLGGREGADRSLPESVPAEMPAGVAPALPPRVA